MKIATTTARKRRRRAASPPDSRGVSEAVTLESFEGFIEE
jgi:hypothetical protein